MQRDVNIYSFLCINRFRLTHIHTHIYIYTCICIYVYIWRERERERERERVRDRKAHIHIYTIICVYVYIYTQKRCVPEAINAELGDVFEDQELESKMPPGMACDSGYVDARET